MNKILTYVISFLIIISSVIAIKPAKCSFYPQIECIDHLVTDKYIKLGLRNDLGKDINITNISASNCKGSASGFLKDKEIGQFTISGCTNKERYKGEITLKYIDQYTGLEKIVKGEVVDLVEDTSSIFYGKPQLKANLIGIAFIIGVFLGLIIIYKLIRIVLNRGISIIIIIIIFVIILFMLMYFGVMAPT
jgi:hypothetical protein